MRQKDLEKYKNRSVKVFLRSHAMFHGIIDLVTENSCYLLDKNNELVSFDLDEISYVQTTKESK